MTADKKQIIVVTGATGLQGSAVARHLLSAGWHVRALTRNIQGERAKSLSAFGAEVVQGDMNEPATLRRVVEGAYGVYSVQNPVTSGVEGEIRQGKNIATAAKQAGIQHLVYGSAGIGVRGTGVPSWESKLIIEDHLKSLGIPFSVIRPMAFMELMTEKKFFPAVSTWHIMPMLMGGSRKVAWLAVDDLGAIVAQIFANPSQFIGQDLKLVSDVQSIDQCREIYRKVTGKNAPRFPMPLWMFQRFGFVGKDLPVMWRWLRDATFDMDSGQTRAIHPAALNVQSWLEKQIKTG